MRLKALIVAKTYPTPAKTGVEVSCTQAITEQGEWVRLFPVPFRLLEGRQRFRKYEWVQVDARKTERDERPESYRIDPDTIEILSDPLPTASEWKERKAIVYPLRSKSMEVLQAALLQSGVSLGVIRPKVIEKLVIEGTESEWTPAQLAKLGQLSLFEEAPPRALEKIPYDFKYVFRCADSRCRGHSMRILDWEAAESYRSWKEKYGAGWEEKFRQKYEGWMVQKRDTHFFVGTHSRWRDRWMITGLFYPPLL
jgi:hypothetical protein